MLNRPFMVAVLDAIAGLLGGVVTKLIHSLVSIQSTLEEISVFLNIGRVAAWDVQ